MDLKHIATQVLSDITNAGFDQAGVNVLLKESDELNVANNVPSLLRSTQSLELTLTGISDGRKASAKTTQYDEHAITLAIEELKRSSISSTKDDAYQLSEGEQSEYIIGPQHSDTQALISATKELMEYRRQYTPSVQIRDSRVTYNKEQRYYITSRETALFSSVGSYEAVVLVVAQEGTHSSGLSYTVGNTESLTDSPIYEKFEIAEVLNNAKAFVHTQSLADKFTGDVILTPNAVESLLTWLLGQVSEMSLLNGSSVLKSKVEELIASPLLNIHSTVKPCGHTPFTNDGFVKQPSTLVKKGRLLRLLPNHYGARKLGIPYQPTASTEWSVASGEEKLENMIASVEKGALVGRLSMGLPSANGDFSGVIKSSFYIENGNKKHTLSEVMISGNIGEMLQNIVAVSQESVDYGNAVRPWLQIKGVHFS